MLIVDMVGWSHDCMSRKGSVLITLLCVCVTSMFGCYFQSRAWLLEMDMKGEGRNNYLICTVGWFSSYFQSNYFSYSSQTSGYNIQYPWGWYDCFIFNPWPTKKDLLFRLGFRSLCLELHLQRLTACSLLLLRSWISSPEYNSQCPNRATRCEEKGRDETSLWETCIWNNGTGGFTSIKLW